MEKRTSQISDRVSIRLILLIYMIILVVGLSVSFAAGNIPGLGKALLTLSTEDFKPDLNSKVLNVSEAGIITYDAGFDKINVPQGEESLAVLVPRLATNGFKIYINGTLAGQRGSVQNRASNLWNASSFISFPTKLLKEHNELRIVSRADYKTGMTTHQIYIMRYTDGMEFENWFNVFNHVAVYIGIGVLMVSAAILVLMFIISERHRRVYLYLALGMISIAIYSVDYTPIVDMCLSYFDYKRIIMISFWATTMFYGLGISRLFRRPAAGAFGVAGFVGIVVISIVSSNMIMFKNIYTYWYVTQLINVIIWIVTATRESRVKLEGRIFLLGFLILGIYSVVNMVIDMSGKLFSMNSPIIYITVFAIVPLMVVYFDVQNRKHLLQSESEQRRRADMLANRDVLTDAYNKRYFQKITSELETPYTLVLFDIDDFKLINDNHGHQAGDETLIYVVDMLFKHLRKDDILCRIGGDEFTVILPAPIDIAKARMESFRDDIKQHKLRYLESEIDFTMSFGMCVMRNKDDIETAVRRADQALYESKEKGKDRITVYSDFRASGEDRSNRS